MDKELKQQIDSRTEADEDQKVIDLLEEISPLIEVLKKSDY